MEYTAADGESVLNIKHYEDDGNLLISIEEKSNNYYLVDFLLNKDQVNKLIQYFKYLEIELEN